MREENSKLTHCTEGSGFTHEKVSGGVIKGINNKSSESMQCAGLGRTLLASLK